MLTGAQTSKYYTQSGAMTWTLKSEEQFYAEQGQPPRKHNKRYFFFTSLEELTRRYPSSGVPADQRAAMAHFLGGLLQLDPMHRWTPDQARAHPLVACEAWPGSWEPPRGLRHMAPLLDALPASASPSPRSGGFQFQLDTDSPSQSPRGAKLARALPFPGDDEADSTPVPRRLRANSASKPTLGTSPMTSLVPGMPPPKHMK